MEDWELGQEEEVEASWWTDPDLLKGMPRMVRATVGAVAEGLEKTELFFCLTNRGHTFITVTKNK